MNLVYIEQYLKFFVKNLIVNDYLYKGNNLRGYQVRKINEMVKFVKKNNEFYKEFYKNINFEIKSIEDIKKLPILKKDIFKKVSIENKILSNGYRKENLSCGSTTGSIGVPLTLCFDKGCIKKRMIVQSRLWKKMRALPYKRFVKIWRDKKLNKVEKKLKKAGLLLVIGVGDVNEPLNSAMSKEKLEKIVKEIVEFKPQVIRGYVSALYSIARIIEEKNIKFDFLESVITSAEYLPKTMWEYFEKVFKVPVFNLYGGTEAPAIAVNNENNYNLEISEDLYFVEVLDKNGNDVKPGEMGLITITDLYSKATPLIRYQIGDMAIVDEKFYSYSNNFRYFVSVEGRTNDIFELEDGSLIYSHLWHIYFRDENWIDKFQVIQKEKNLINIKILPINYCDKNFKKLRKKIESKFPKVNFEWEMVNKFELINGKFRAIISLVENKFNKFNKG